MEMRISGDDVLISRFKMLPKNVQARLLKHALKAGTEKILATAKELVPVDSGALRDGLVVMKAKRKRGRVGFFMSTPTREELAKRQPTAEKARDVYNGAGYYPAVIEFGSSKFPARPYIRPAFEVNTAQIIQMAEDDIREAMDKRAGVETDDGDAGGVDPNDDVAPDAPVHTGKRGGRYRMSRTGKRVYVSRWSFGGRKA